MKHSLPLFMSIAGMTFATPALAADGAALFSTKACVACHHVENDQSAMGLGPSVKMIGTAYDGKKEQLVKFLSADPTAKPIVKPELYPVMQGQQQITKAMSDDEKSAVADYILSKK
jgi:cytochrome c551/c552